MRVSFQAAVFALLVGIGAFAAFLAMMVQGPLDRDAVPQDLFLVGVNLPLLGLIVYVASSVALYFGSPTLQWTMAAVLAAFVGGLTFMWLEVSEDDADGIYLMAMLLPGAALIMTHWFFTVLRVRGMEGRIP